MAFPKKSWSKYKYHKKTLLWGKTHSTPHEGSKNPVLSFRPIREPSVHEETFLIVLTRKKKNSLIKMYFMLFENRACVSQWSFIITLIKRCLKNFLQVSRSHLSKMSLIQIPICPNALHARIFMHTYLPILVSTIYNFICNIFIPGLF